MEVGCDPSGLRAPKYSVVFTPGGSVTKFFVELYATIPLTPPLIPSMMKYGCMLDTPSSPPHPPSSPPPEHLTAMTASADWGQRVTDLPWGSWFVTVTWKTIDTSLGRSVVG